MLKHLLILVLSMLPVMSLASDSGECGNTCQKEKVSEYFSLLSEIYKKGSDAEDIDALFKVLAPDVEYEHLTYGASFNREEWRGAFYSNLERGAYKNEPGQFIRVDNTIHGNNYVAVAYSYVLKSKDDSVQPEGDQNLLAVFGFTNGKISSVKEYW
ncbi:hypothetical protein [Gilvimarinus algae]|uniref:SnoaL-like domain-containing protein n=1 Tax=Gilvimarinus algae TaxID=3058037 RepID=A0ABT8TEJ4_9GAMM|nr:hypothetical protein [Gilvimarinus sp. SDUM040014]MDO3382458.1 hypothetical protein [Gilvimarinus sp. SDUM040014]